jgi:hypothetical protein
MLLPWLVLAGGILLMAGTLGRRSLAVHRRLSSLPPQSSE